jgi:hypothetical protein
MTSFIGLDDIADTYCGPDQVLHVIRFGLFQGLDNSCV